MKIMLEANFDFGNGFKKWELELDSTDVTLKSLLHTISNKYYEGMVCFIDPETETIDSSEYSVTVNSIRWDLLPQGTGSKLNDGDKVQIIWWMDMLGGG